MGIVAVQRSFPTIVAPPNPSACPIGPASPVQLDAVIKLTLQKSSYIAKLTGGHPQLLQRDVLKTAVQLVPCNRYIALACPTCCAACP